MFWLRMNTGNVTPGVRSCFVPQIRTWCDVLLAVINMQWKRLWRKQKPKYIFHFAEREMMVKGSLRKESRDNWNPINDKWDIVKNYNICFWIQRWVFVHNVRLLRREFALNSSGTQVAWLQSFQKIAPETSTVHSMVKWDLICNTFKKKTNIRFRDAWWLFWTLADSCWSLWLLVILLQPWVADQKLKQHVQYPCWKQTFLTDKTDSKCYVLCTALQTSCFTFHLKAWLG